MNQKLKEKMSMGNKEQIPSCQTNVISSCNCFVGFLSRERIKQLFESDDIQAQQEIVDKYNKYRSDKSTYEGSYCYCGHTDRCECSDPGISEFKSGLFNGTITEELLNKIL